MATCLKMVSTGDLLPVKVLTADDGTNGLVLVRFLTTNKWYVEGYETTVGADAIVTCNRLDLLPDTTDRSELSVVACLEKLMSLVHHTVATHHLDLMDTAYPFGCGMAREEWRRRVLNVTHETDGALVTRIPGAGVGHEFAVTLKDGRTFYVWREAGKGWHVMTCIKGTIHRTRTLDPRGKTGAQVFQVVQDAFPNRFDGRPLSFAHDADVGEVPAPVTHSDGKPDTRYTVRIEGTGTPEPRPAGLKAGHAWVARFCGEWIGSADYPEQAVKLVKDHAAARNAVLDGNLAYAETELRVVRQHHPAGRRKWSREEWEREAIYIYSVRPPEPGSDFGNRPETFRTYCDMQARFATEDGFPHIAETIRKHVGLEG